MMHHSFLIKSVLTTIKKEFGLVFGKFKYAWTHVQARPEPSTSCYQGPLNHNDRNIDLYLCFVDS